MAQSYTRQSTFVDGDTITAALFNDEYNQLENAFTYSSSSATTTGHRHDGTAGTGVRIYTSTTTAYRFVPNPINTTKYSFKVIA